MKIARIFEGWLKRFKLLKGDWSLSARRLKICESCSRAKKSKIIEIFNGNVLEVNSMVCTKCHCPCLEKSLVKKERCPLGKW